MDIIWCVYEGVTSVAFERNERDQVVVTGQGVDATMLTRCLRRKLKYANLVSVDKA